MATIGPAALTLMDWAKRIDDDGKIAEIVNLLSQTNEILDDMLWMEGNLPTGHKTTVGPGFPKLTGACSTWAFRPENRPPRRSPRPAASGDLSRYRRDARRACRRRQGAFSLSEELAFLEGMNQQMAQTIFYNNITALPARPDHPAARGFHGTCPEVSERIDRDRADRQ